MWLSGDHQGPEGGKPWGRGEKKQRVMMCVPVSAAVLKPIAHVFLKMVRVYGISRGGGGRPRQGENIVSKKRQVQKLVVQDLRTPTLGDATLF